MKVLGRLFAIGFISILLAAVVLPGTQAATVVTSSNKRHSDNTIHVKFKETVQASVQDGRFVSETGKALEQVNSTLSGSGAKERLLRSDRSEVTNRRNRIRQESNANAPDMNGYYRIKLRPGQQMADALARLKAQDSVEAAYAEPLPAPAPAATPNFAGLQNHFKAAPKGLGITVAAANAGSQGGSVQIADIEYSWNTSHEDIAGSSQVVDRWNNGTPVDPFNDDGHGTAVAGALLAKRNGIGVDGIVPNVKLHLVNATNAERNWDMANAVYLAASRMSAGDVILLEQQTWGPNGTLVPVEWVPAVYDAIVLARSSGIIVVETAGNGSVNLDDPLFGGVFTSARADSGAIMVGAGGACGYNNQPDRSRMAFSNYGTRVNVQGYGECVVTTGFGGDLFWDGTSRAYTKTFGGTSSAGAIVGGVVAALSSSFENKTRTPLAPARARAVLVNTATAQNNSVNPGNIGPQPNLPSAIASALDTVKPSAPTKLEASLNASNKVVLTWSASTDAVGVKGYQIYRNGVYLKTVNSLNYTDTTVAKKTKYTYKVRAYDATLNYSADSLAVSVTTRP